MTKAARKKILLTWEFGNDFGHIARLGPLARLAMERGHQVVLATGNLHNVDRLPEWLDVIPAPAVNASHVTDPIRQPATFADILYNAGVTHSRWLAGVARAWHGIHDLVKPDVVVMDYSPLAMLALQGRPTPRVLLGTGFACPPPVPRLPDVRAWQNHYPDRIRATEDRVLQSLNTQLTNMAQTTLSSIGELFTRMDANLLATFPELDHYPQRTQAADASHEYCGTWSDLEGEPPCWPGIDGPRIFAYLKPFRGLPRLLDHLQQCGHPTLVFLPADMDTSRWQSSSMTIVSKPLRMEQVAADCDLALLHAGHGSTAAMLLAGKPVVQMPFVVEQYHTAQNTERLGAGIHVAVDDVDAICMAFDRAVSDPELRTAAGTFASRHSDHDPTKALSRVIQRIEECARP